LVGRLMRQVHLYLALFLMPWMVMYGLSAIVMNHMDFFRRYYGGNLVRYEKEKELTHAGPPGSHADAKAIARQVLNDLHLDGAHGVQVRRGSRQIIIFRNDPIWPQRITFLPEEHKLVIERQVFRLPLFLRRLHVRHGYGRGYLADDAWALSVDLVVLAILFWGVSGLWIWWGLRRMRRWGLVFGLTGACLFLAFLLLI